MSTVVFAALAQFLVTNVADVPHGITQDTQSEWQAALLTVPYTTPEPGQDGPILQLVHQDHEELEFSRSVIKTPMIIGERRFQRGLGTHSESHIRVHSPEPIEGFSAWIGVDNNERTQGSRGSVIFSVSADGRVLYRSGILRGQQKPEPLDVDVKGAMTIELRVEDGGDGRACDHADWADAAITTRGGQSVWLDEVKPGIIPVLASQYPFSFIYGGKHVDKLLGDWVQERRMEILDGDRTQIITTWTDPDTRLRLHWEATQFSDFPAAEWLLRFENVGDMDTPIIENLQALDLTFASPRNAHQPYLLHRTNGAPSDPTDFEVSTVVIDSEDRQVMGGGGGRSSNRDFPFFKVETGHGSFIIAVGWSGQWQANLKCQENACLHVTAGLENTHFLLHPGEQVRSPRMLVFYWDGETLESNAQFRQLIYKHYVARRSGEKPLPTLYSNTCFTRGGGWLNECNAENQISLIKAYAPLGLQAVITDAGWFEGGWPAGAGNWTPRKDAYPAGMGPVAAAAEANNMIYGLWFEPERVVSETWLHKNRPEWCLRSTDEAQGTYLLNFGLEEVQDYFFSIVKGFMDLPGFRVYRQDFNMDPLPYWQYADAPDRQGMTEMKYIEGLYAYWERIASAWPEGLRVECASGGRRIDLETITRMHVHQKSDYWFHNEVDQASIWGLSQYLPNNISMAPIDRMDEYTFHSVMGTSLCIGWIADEPDFDHELAKAYTDSYRELRHLLIGAWYPLLPYSREDRDWIASQYHRPDLDEGMILVFRRPGNVYVTVELSLHGLESEATYELSYSSTGEKAHLKGADLMRAFRVTLAAMGQSDLITYRRLTDSSGNGTQTNADER